MNPIVILGIESSCDDTSCAVVIDGKIASNVVANQKIHQQYGGVVPELASRAHQQNIIPSLMAALQQANIPIKDISAIAFTNGPGLLGALLVGSSFAKGLSLALNKPLIEVNHLQAHVLSAFAQTIDKPVATPSFPFITLLVSGGHTQIILVKDYLDMTIVGTTTDDAAGEAFDKAAKILGLDYPGGPLIDKFAQNGNPEKFLFAKPKVPNFDYSFSGLKTSVLYFIRDQLKQDANFIDNNLTDICAALQKTIVDILFDKLIKASEHFNINNISIAGGVAANSAIRQRLLAESKKRNWKVFIPEFQYCTDNAGMIALTGYFKYLANVFTHLNTTPKARYEL